MAEVAPEEIEGVEADPESILTDERDSADSALGSDVDSTRSASITSSITGYKYENGRRYHAYREGAYYLPNDDAEQARLDLVHHVFRLSLDGRLFAAPVEQEIKRCLDCGTGTGIWAIDFADEHPDADIVGNDLSPIQPTWVPPNLHFYVDDLENEWNYSNQEYFDFVHERSLGGSIADWPRLMKQCFDALKPGGWCEFQEYEGWAYSDTDPKLDKSPNLRDWVQFINEASSKFGKEFNIAPQLKKLMTEAGLVDVTQKIVHVPIGTWAKGKKAKEMGAFHREDLCDAVDSFTAKLFTHVLGWTPEECQVLQAKVKEEMRDNRCQVYTKFWFVYGRKPDK